MSEWIHGWIRNGRLDTPDALANQDLWQQLAALSRQHQVSWEWVRGHAGHPFNERCDKLAKRAVDDGIRAAAAAKPAAKTEPEEKAIPWSVAPASQASVPTREDVEFDIEEDGQLRLC